MVDLMTQPAVIYVADPMCSWCWGFSPVIRKIADKTDGVADLRIVMGGLRAGNTKPMDEGMSDYISGAWQRVGERTGAVFDFAFFERDGFVYDTEPACRAVVSARQLDASRALDMMTRIQSAFYANNRDVTDRQVLGEIAVEAGFDGDAFLTAFDADEAQIATKQDFQIANQSGISGFPAVLIGKPAEGFGALTLGYQDYDTLAPTLDAWLADVAQAA